MDNISLAEALNPAQLSAVEYIDGPSLVIAGAGSGKTRVLTYKIAYLMQQGYAPYSILALTFTNKAAREMKERIAKLVGEDRAAMLWMGTFHSIAARILRREADVLGFEPQFTIYDAADSLSLVKTIIKEMGLNDKVYPPKTVAGIISRAKERLIQPRDYLDDRATYMQNERNNMPMVGEIYQNYQNRLRSSGSMDFDDLLLYTHLLFHEHEDVRQRYAQRFRFLLVDEYQDTNRAQHAIVWQLAHEHRHVCVVGDDAQSIYSFRGANIENILNFREVYDNAKLFKLEQNYRSTQMIVGAASSLIAHNTGQIPKDVFSCGEEGEPLHVLPTFSDMEESSVVARRIEALHRRSYGYGDFAILYRTNFQSRSFEEALRRAAIPYRIYGGLSFYQRKEIKDVIAYCRLSINPNDEEALRRVVNYPARGIGQTTLTRLGQAALDHGSSIWDAINNGWAEVNRGAQAKLEGFAAMINGFRELALQTDASTLMSKIVKDSGIEKELKEGKEPEDEIRRENVKELLRAVAQFVAMRIEEGEPCAMTDYLQEVSLVSDIDEDDSTEPDKVVLMTIHSAKGLEFPVVFIVGMEEELFPSARCADNPRAIEEERRLCYVAITRAMNLCYMTYANTRFKYGQSQTTIPSRFIDEIDDRWTNSGSRYSSPALPGYRATPKSPVAATPITTRPYTSPVPTTPVTRSSSAPASQKGGRGVALSPNQRVSHPRFGLGTVVSLSGAGKDAKATVRFDNMGVKVLLLRFAQLDIV